MMNKLEQKSKQVSSIIDSSSIQKVGKLRIAEAHKDGVRYEEAIDFAKAQGRAPKEQDIEGLSREQKLGLGSILYSRGRFGWAHLKDDYTYPAGKHKAVDTAGTERIAEVLPYFWPDSAAPFVIWVDNNQKAAAAELRKQRNNGNRNGGYNGHKLRR
jgi:hypothetical protein